MTDGEQGEHRDWRATRIFVSHSHADNAFGLRLVADLRRILGHEESVWYDAAGGLQGGDAWWRTIREELTSRPVFLVLVSPSAMDSIWVNNEIDMAWAQRNAARDEQGRPAGKRILPVLVEASKIRADLATLHEDMVSFVPPASYEASLRALLDRLGVPKGAEHLPPPPPPLALPDEPDADAGDGLALTRERLAPAAKQDTKQGMTRRKVLAAGGVVATAAVVGGFADLFLTRSAPKAPSMLSKGTPVSTASTKGAWQQPVSDLVTKYAGSQLVVVGNRVVVGGSHGAYAFDATTGSTVWQFSSANALPSTAYAVLNTGSTVVIGATKLGLYQKEATTIYGLDAASGRSMWSFGDAHNPLYLEATIATAATPLVLATQNIDPYVEGQWYQTHNDGSSMPKNTYVLNPVNGSLVTTLSRTDADFTEMYSDGQTLLEGALEVSNGTFVSYDARTMAQRWSTTMGLPGTPLNGTFVSGVLVDGVMYLLSADGVLTAVDAVQDALLWKQQVGPNPLPAPPPGDAGPVVGVGVSALVPAGSLLLFTLTDGHIYAVDRQSGNLVWHRNPTVGTFAEETTYPAAADAHLLYVPYQNGYLRAYDLSNGNLKWVSPQLEGGLACAPVVVKGMVCVVDTSQTVYGFNAEG